MSGIEKEYKALVQRGQDLGLEVTIYVGQPIRQVDMRRSVGDPTNLAEMISDVDLVLDLEEANQAYRARFKPTYSPISEALAALFAEDAKDPAA